MKKIALLMVILITTFTIGCDFFSGTTSSQTDQTTTNSNGEVTFETNPYITANPNVDELRLIRYLMIQYIRSLPYTSQKLTL